MLLTGEGPIEGLSPVIQRIFLIPIALSPTISDCNLQRVVSREAICKIGSALSFKATVLQATLDILGRADDESVKLIAVTKDFTDSMLLISLVMPLPEGGVTSVAITNSPDRNRRSSSEAGSE
jgi:hypothetical protein